MTLEPDRPNLPRNKPWRLEVVNGIKIGLFFLVAFLLLGYPVVISLVLGLMGGLAGGWIIRAWNTPEELEELPLLPNLQETLESVEDRTRLETWRRMESKPRLTQNVAKVGWKKFVNFLGNDNRPEE